MTYIDLENLETNILPSYLLFFSFSKLRIPVADMERFITYHEMHFQFLLPVSTCFTHGTCILHKNTCTQTMACLAR